MKDDSGVTEVLLANPRGFCAGGVRPIESVGRALALHGAPVYVRHEIVHNRYVVDELAAKGAIFVDNVSEVPEGQRVIYSAHGVAPEVREDSAKRKLRVIDATCPLVKKVHREAQIHFKHGREIVLIGHAGHPEVIGTMGQLPDGAVRLVETEADARALAPKSPDRPALRNAVLNFADAAA